MAVSAHSIIAYARASLLLDKYVIEERRRLGAWEEKERHGRYGPAERVEDEIWRRRNETILDQANQEIGFVTIDEFGDFR